MGIYFRAWGGGGDRLEFHDFLGGPEIERIRPDEGITMVFGCTRTEQPSQQAREGDNHIPIQPQRQTWQPHHISRQTTT